MTAKVFVDTNIILYLIGIETKKKNISRDIVATHPMLSTQVINESINVCLRKFKFSREKAYAFADSVMLRTDVLPIDEITVRKSAQIAIRHTLSNWDALIIASALLANCDILYSEDMHHTLHIENRLTIVNPFL